MFDPGRETPLSANGKTYTVSRLTVEAVLAFRDWVREQTGDPFADLLRCMDKLPADFAKEQYVEAKALRDQLECFSLQTPLAQKWMQTETGIAEFMRIMLAAKHPGITANEAFQVVMAAGKDKMKATIDKAQGQLESEKNS